MARDFSSISPSAKSLLLVKSQTTLPFARKAAEHLWGAGAVTAAGEEAAANPGANLRRRHFEIRARSLDQALAATRTAHGGTRVLEIAAGLSFRGLALAAREDVFYVDTDLPAIAAIKAELVTTLHPTPLAGTLRVAALDALDAEAFREAVRQMPPGPLAVLHEGLLMYLDPGEKARLAASVREALLERGGAWLTADVYVRSEAREAVVFREERTKKFLEQHRVEQNKFADWSEAEAFFTGAGFAVTERISSSVDPWHGRETWVLAARG
jgi:O-methyltransferase involved in polyketide biosynthesis